jgi:xanthine dehydrogenase accessory factor
MIKSRVRARSYERSDQPCVAMALSGDRIMSELTETLAAAFDWLAQGRRVAIATVIQTWGSSPRPVGARLVIDEHGGFLGSVSGGCVEGAVIEEAFDVIETGRPVVLDFGVSDEKAWTAGLSCGGKISVFVEPLRRGDRLQQAFADQRRGREVFLATRLADALRLRPDLDAGAPLVLKDAAQRKRSRRIETDEGEFFFEFWSPDLRLMLVGAVHIAQALAPIAAACGYRPTIIDPRSAFATPERFPGLVVEPVWPDEFLPNYGLDAGCAFVALTHDPKIDDRALAAALRGDAFYIGALGSNKSKRAREDRLRAQGFGEADLARIHGPVGLDIGAVGPAEIAVSIMAEITSCRHQVTVATRDVAHAL